MSHTSRRRTLAAAATALLAFAPSAPAAQRAPQPDPTAVGARTATHAQTPSDLERAYDANVGAYTPGSIPAVSYPSGGAYTPGSIPAVSYPSGATAGVRPTPGKNPAGGGVNPTMGLGIAGSLLAIAGVVGLARRSRRTQRTRVTA